MPSSVFISRWPITITVHVSILHVYYTRQQWILKHWKRQQRQQWNVLRLKPEAYDIWSSFLESISVEFTSLPMEEADIIVFENVTIPWLIQEAYLNNQTLQNQTFSLVSNKKHSTSAPRSNLALEIRKHHQNLHQSEFKIVTKAAHVKEGENKLLIKYPGTYIHTLSSWWWLLLSLFRWNFKLQADSDLQIKV